MKTMRLLRRSRGMGHHLNGRKIDQFSPPVSPSSLSSFPHRHSGLSRSFLSTSSESPSPPMWESRVSLVETLCSEAIQAPRNQVLSSARQLILQAPPIDNGSYQITTHDQSLETSHYNRLIHACIVSFSQDNADSIQTLDTAKLILDTMRSRGAKPDTLTYSLMMSLHTVCRDQEAVLQLYQDMQHLNIPPNGHIVAYVLQALRECQQSKGGSTESAKLVSQAWALFDQCDRLGVTQHYDSIGFLLEITTKAANRVEFERALKKAEEKGILKTRVAALNLALKGLANFREPLRGLDLYESVRTYGHCPNTGTILALLTLCRVARDSTRAWKLFEEFKQLPRYSPNYCVHLEMMNTMVAIGEREGFERTFKEAGQLGFLQNPVVLNVAIKGMTRFGDALTNLYSSEILLTVQDADHNHTLAPLNRSGISTNSDLAWRLYEECAKFGSNPQLMCTMMNFTVETKDQDGFEHMFKEVEQFGLFHSSAFALSVALKGAAEFNDPLRGLHLYDETMRRPNTIRRDTVLLVVLIRICCMLRNPARVLGHYNEYTQRYGVKPNGIIIFRLVNAMVVNNDPIGFKVALKEARRVGLNSTDVGVLTACLTGAANFGDPRLGLQLYEEGLRAGLRPTRLMLLKLFQLCDMLDDAKRGWNLYKEFIQLGGRPDNVVLCMLAKLMIRCGTSEGFFRAEKLLRATPDPDNIRWAVLILGYSRFYDNIEKALSVLDEIRSHGQTPTTDSVTALLTSCLKRRDVDTAHRVVCQLKREGVDINRSHMDILLSLAESTDTFDEILQMQQDSLVQHKQGHDDTVHERTGCTFFAPELSMSENTASLNIQN